MGFWIVDLGNAEHALKVNAWNWRPTLELLPEFAVLSEDQLEVMAYNSDGEVTLEQARAIAVQLSQKLRGLEADDRLRLDLSVTNEPDDGTFYRNDPARNYSATRDWLERFADFCQTCDGFMVS